MDTAAAQSDAPKYFDFFGLPREQRDYVFAGIGGHEATVALPSQPPTWPIEKASMPMVMTLTAAPRVSMLLISKQFKREYEEELRRQAGLRVHPHDHDSIEPPPFSLVENDSMKSYLAHVTRLDLRSWEGLREGDDSNKHAKINVEVHRILFGYLGPIQNVYTEFHMNMDPDGLCFDEDFWRERFQDQQLENAEQDRNSRSRGTKFETRFIFYGAPFCA